jgi:hypothetical protein
LGVNIPYISIVETFFFIKLIPKLTILLISISLSFCKKIYLEHDLFMNYSEIHVELINDDLVGDKTHEMVWCGG